MTYKKILYLVTEDWYFCSHRLDLAKEAIKKNFKVYLLANMGEYKEYIEKQGIEVISLRFMSRSRVNIFSEIISILEILFVLLKIKPDILHSVALKPVIYGSFASIFTGRIKNINALGGLGFIFSSGSLKARFLRPLILTALKFIFSRRKSKLIVQNRDDYIFVSKKLKIEKNNICLIEGAGVDLKKFSIKQKTNQIPFVLLASRMIWAKGVGEFVAAASLLNERGVKAKFVLVGKPDNENPNCISKKQLLFWHRSGIVEWMGYKRDMVSIFKQSSIVTLPSYYGEGIPKVLIEAMACSKPIVTTYMPGCKELVIEEKNGLLIKPRDHINLANALEKLILNPELCLEMGQYGRKLAEIKYDQKKIFNEILDLYIND